METLKPDTQPADTKEQPKKASEVVLEQAGETVQEQADETPQVVRRKREGKWLSRWMDNQEVCQQLRISPRTLQTLRDNGTLAYSQIGHKIFYKPEDVQRIVRLVEDRRKDAAYRGCSI